MSGQKLTYINAILEEELKNLSEQAFLDLINIDILKEFEVNKYNYEITRKIINLIKDAEKRNELLVYLFENMANTVEINESDATSITVYDLMVANILGRVLKELDKMFFDKILERFNKAYDSIILPYSFFKKKDLWYLNISKLIFYLIAIYVYDYPNMGNINDCLEKYNKAKNNLSHFSDKEFENIIKQISPNFSEEKIL